MALINQRVGSPPILVSGWMDAASAKPSLCLRPFLPSFFLLRTPFLTATHISSSLSPHSPSLLSYPLPTHTYTPPHPIHTHYLH